MIKLAVREKKEKSVSKVSVIMATYNNLESLQWALLGFLRQTYPEFELIISEDGSSGGTQELIHKICKDAPFPIIYLWQEDLGIRKTKALNEGVKHSSADYLIFTDPDCIPHRDFIKEHMKHREQGCYLVGRRVRWGPKYSSILTKDFILSGDYERFSLRWIYFAMRGDVEYPKRAIKVKYAWMQKWLEWPSASQYLQGCNFSIYKEDLEKVNGWNEEIKGLGGEDIELDLRLRNAGMKRKSVKNLAITYHSHHPDRKRSFSLDSIFEELERTGQYWCENGIVKHINNKSKSLESELQ
jgi:glycosyltransferase involved in cell wall biosynthesis